jgi:transposase
MQLVDTEKMTITEVCHLPIVKHYAKQINLVDTVDAMVSSQMETSAGLTVLAMVLDTLSGRTPLYRLTEFFEDKDTEILLGEGANANDFADHNLGRVLDSIYKVGTQNIFAQLSQNAIGAFQVDTRQVHYDTTSISVFGDYDWTDPPFNITYGHSKDRRPDLKQFLIEMLCVERSIPVLGATRDGNASDKTLNNELLTNISKHMARHGIEPGAFVYIADSAFVTKANLDRADEHNVCFLSRLPANFNECSRAIEQAVSAENWTDIGPLAETPGTVKRPQAHYSTFETTVSLCDRDSRAIVVHSSAHDKRRHKRNDRMLSQKQKQLAKEVKAATADSYFCEADARQAAHKLNLQAKGTYHKLKIDIRPIAKFGRGRPANDRPRVPVGYRYELDVAIEQDAEAIKPLLVQAGCFVLLCNVPESYQGRQWAGGDLLALYKEQYGIEKNFGFLKDPVIVNSVFLKKPERIEVLGLILLIALLIWRLIERSLRQYVQEQNCTISGWDKRQTTRPTTFMMTTKFINIFVVTMGKQRSLARPLKPVQVEYLNALKLTPDIYINP